MSLSELLSVRIKDESRFTERQWGVGYHYTRVGFGDYLKKQRTISKDSLLGVANGRTYPIVQTRITQEAHVFSLTYKVSEATSLSLLLPYIRQATEHESILPGFSDFMIKSAGLGDLTLSASHSLGEDAQKGWTLSAGVSIPSGSIMKKGHTPFGPRSQLPYSMQLGSGTWDFPMSVSYRNASQGWNWGGQAFSKVRTRHNQLGYRLGNELLISAWVNTQVLQWLQVSIKLVGQSWAAIKGNDDNFPGPNYPAPMSNPDAFGGRKANMLFGVRLTPPWVRSLVGQTLSMEYSRPIYQSLNGPQQAERYRFGLGWTHFF